MKIIKRLGITFALAFLLTVLLASDGNKTAAGLLGILLCLFGLIVCLTPLTHNPNP